MKDTPVIRMFSVAIRSITVSRFTLFTQIKFICFIFLQTRTNIDSDMCFQYFLSFKNIQTEDNKYRKNKLIQPPFRLFS